MELEELLQAIMLSGGSPFMGAANLGRELGMGLGRSQETPAEEYPRIETRTPTSSPPSVFTGNPTTPAPSPAMASEDQEPRQDAITDEQIAEMLQSGMFVMRGNRAGTAEEMASALAHRDKQRRGETGSFSMTPSPGFTAPSIRMMNEALAFKRAQAANEQAGKYDAEKLSGRVSDVDKKGAYNLLNAQISANLIADPQLTEKLRAAIAAGDLSEQDLAMLLEQIKAGRPAKGS